MVNSVVLLNENKERLTSEDLTVRVGCEGVRVTGFFDHTKATERPCERSVWVLMSIDDDQVLGEKPVVSVFSTERVARMAMMSCIAEDCQEKLIDSSSIEYSIDRDFAQTKDGRFSWEIVEVTVKEDVR